MDSQEGITHAVFSAIRDRLVAKSDWGAIAGSLIIAQQLVLQAWASYRSGSYVPLDLPTIALVVLIFVTLGFRSSGTPKPSV